ncbi:MAG: phenylacetic acid degradation protein [Dehalococcoidia bacterium]|nr:phenylacetic acid degradation protein [Dehalococcoidia bacterium]
MRPGGQLSKDLLTNLDNLRSRFSESKFHKWLGLEVVSYVGGELHVRLPFREEFFGTKEETNIHGGIISTLADAATCFVVELATGNEVPNLNLYVDYLRMAPGNSDLNAYAKVVKLGRTICVSEVDIKSDTGRHIATGRSIIMNNAPARTDIVSGGKN